MIHHDTAKVPSSESASDIISEVGGTNDEVLRLPSSLDVDKR
jgi:hypothetical protein